MKKIKIGFPTLFGLLLILCFGLQLQAQVLQKEDYSDKPVKPQDYPAGTGVGHMVAGDMWDSFLVPPSSSAPYYSEAGTAPTYGIRQFMRVGNYDRAWSTGNGNWPHAFPFTIWWARYMHALVYDSDPTFCPKQINGKDNPAYVASSKDPSGDWSRYVTIAYHANLDGAKDPNRKYVKEAYYVDGTTRNHLVAEAAWPTNVGLDVKLRVHQFAAPNWNNLNDFVIYEVSFKNTGNVDLNLDGTFEKTNHKIQGLVLNFGGDAYMSITNDLGGRRNGNYPCNVAARMAGYIGDPDPNGEPWDFAFMWTGTSAIPPTVYDMGLGVFQLKYYTDQYHGYSWIAVKKGGLPSDPAKSTGKLPDKENIWGVDAIGKGAQRGWFGSSGTWQGLNAWYSTPKNFFVSSIGTYYVNGGKDNNANNFDLKPNPKFFDITKNNTAEDITKWVPKKTTGITEAERPNGDRKLLSLETGDAAFMSRSDADGMETATTPYPTGWGKFTKGFSKTINFDGELFVGAGPVSLDVGEEVTFVLATAAGFRLEGIQKAFRAARWAYANEYNIPTPPPVPDMKVANTTNKSVNIEWDTRAESDAQFAGYKIWKSSNFKKYYYLEDGMRLVDKYQEQMTVGEDKSKYRKPINPKFNAFADVAAASTKGQYAGYTWGTWELVKVIPKAELNNYKKAVTPGYTYLYEDKDVVLGFTYWYYVSAYKEGTFTGPGGETTNRIETHSLNRNGASGLWEGTFPFASSNPYYPTTADGLKKIGAPQVVYSALVDPADLNSGKVKIGVRPNPYKRAALHDNFTNVYDHKILFYNLPPKAKITITDVAGKVIQVINFQSSDANRGSTFWDMFSKDGMEVASGLYLYFVEYDGGSTSGKFAILR